MPLYDYRCECGVVTEARQRVDVMFIVCRACGGTAKRAPFPREFGIAGETVAKPSHRTLTEEARLEHREKKRCR